MPIPLGPVAPAPVGVNIRPVGQALDRITADLDGFVLGVVGDTGVNVHLANLEGWWGVPASTGEVTQRVSDHGAWLGEAWYGPRQVALTVRLRGAQFDHVTPVLNALQAKVPLNRLADLLVDDGELLTAQVRQSGEVAVKRYGVGADVSIGLIAPDPRRYSPQTEHAATALPSSSGGLRAPFRTPVRVVADSVSGVLHVVNSGTVETNPVLTVQGPCPPFAITNRTTGQTLRFHEQVPAGRFLQVDTRARTALLDGFSPRYITGDFPTYVPGPNEVAFTADTYVPDALLLSEHRHAYL